MSEKKAMENQSPFKAFEYSGWQQCVGQYHSSFGKLTPRTVNALLRNVEPVCGRLLDVACGPGYVCAEASARGWRASGLDFSEEMVEKARSTYPACSFNVGDAEALPVNDGELDAVVINFGILHLANPEAAVREAFRVLRPGGRLAFSVWAPPSEAVGFAVVLSAIERAGDMSVPLPPGPPFFKYSDRDEAARLLQGAGFDGIRAEKLPLLWHLTDGDELFDAFLRGTARTGGLLRAQDPTALAKIREIVVAEGDARFRNGSGHLEIPMPAMVYGAVKPQ